MKSSIYNYRLAKIEDTSELLKLLNNNLSFGLAKNEVIENLITNNQIYVVTRKNELIGLMIIKRVESVSKLLFNHQKAIDALKAHYKKNEELYTISHFVVKEEYRVTMVAYRLCEFASNKHNDKNMVLVGWKQPNGWQAESIAKKMGFEILIEIKNFWLEDSLQNSYGCPHCKNGCYCSAIIANKKAKMDAIF